jgi:hypothetical protein
MSDLLPIFSRVVGVFLVMVAGAMARRFEWVTREADVSISRLIANLLFPAFFIDRILATDRFDRLEATWLPPLVGLLSTSLQLLLAVAFARTIGPRLGIKDRGAQSALALSIGLCNYGYIPLPLAQFLYPDAEASLILHNVGVDLAIWSVGIWVIAGDRLPATRQGWITPPIIAIVAAAAVKATGLHRHIPEAFFQMTEALGQCAVPMGLALSGAILFDFLRELRWRESLGTLIAACGFRLLAMPMALIAIAALLPMPLEMRQVLLLQAAMPAAVFSVILTRLYEQDVKTAVAAIIGTSIIGLISIPVWLYVGQALLPGSN